MLTEETLREKAGEERFAQGQQLLRRAQVREIQASREECVYLAADQPPRQVRVTAASVQCACGEKGLCAHAVAAALAALSSGRMREMEAFRAQQAGPALLEAVGAALPEMGNIGLTPVLIWTPEALRIGLRAGEERRYVVRHIPQFLQCRAEKKNLAFGKSFQYEPQWMRFDDRQERLLDLLTEYCEITGARRLAGAEGRLLRLPPRTGARVMEALEGLPFILQAGEKKYTLPGVVPGRLHLNFHLSGTPARLLLTAELPEDLLPVTPDFRFALAEGECLALSHEQQTLMRALWPYADGQEARFFFSAQDTARMTGELLPFLLRMGTVTMEPALDARFVRLPLVSRVYLDKAGGDVTAQIAFLYGQTEINPFSPDSPPAGQLLLRDAAAEGAVMEELARDGFRVRRGQAYLTGQEKIYEFITQGASRLAEKAQVFFSKDFQRLTPRRPLFHGSVTLRNGHLQLEMMDGDTPVEELLPLMEAIRRKRRYFRFRDGAYLDLSESEPWLPLAEAVAEAGESEGHAVLGACWAAYLAAVVRENSLDIALDDSAARAADLSYDAPPPPVSCLRPYQRRGYAWLMSLHALGMGGILADDMGLGKTVQTLAALLACVRNEGERLPSLIVAPTSLTYNWLSESRKFTPELSVLLLSGSQAARAEQIARLASPDAPDLVITSYPLIRRDIALMREIPFRFAVLDEAQQIKNIQSVGANAVKQLTARTRIALTGTPMENHAGELWSLFDFVLPGYLPRYTEFLRRWGEGQDAAELRRRIRPFLMRRLRADVLDELPEKQESLLIAELPPEQRRVYDAVLMQKRERVADILRGKGLFRGRAEVLSAITELRQICCHPVLCLPDYPGVSAKLELLMDVLPAALSAGRRALVFSQFTSMLRIIERRLAREGIPCLYLDGETPAARRVELCERFNGGETNVFLISLKAGGTGLNLTGADLVIHYDPWWNPTAEEQATSRAHRIGQTRTVEVVRLAVHHSIEEQVLSMGERKRRLFDQLITPGEKMPTRLTDKDILSLFDAGADSGYNGSAGGYPPERDR